MPTSRYLDAGAGPADAQVVAAFRLPVGVRRDRRDHARAKLFGLARNRFCKSRGEPIAQPRDFFILQQQERLMRRVIVNAAAAREVKSVVIVAAEPADRLDGFGCGRNREGPTTPRTSAARSAGTSEACGTNRDAAGRQSVPPQILPGAQKRTAARESGAVRRIVKNPRNRGQAEGDCGRCSKRRREVKSVSVRARMRGSSAYPYEIGQPRRIEAGLRPVYSSPCSVFSWQVMQ